MARARPSLAAALLSLLVWDTVSRAHGFNLETRLPIVKRGHTDSYFGYSVAGHQSYDELKAEVEHSWILVGAPIDQNLQPGTNQSGALWKCPLTSKHDDCQQVVTDGKRNKDNGQYNSSIDSINLSPPLDDEIKDGQWLGVMVRSQGRGGKVVVCAHRYISKGKEYQWGQGLCYTLSQYLDFIESWAPCKGREVDNAHLQFGYCQAGTSGVILEDDTVVLGSPGSYNWRGNIFMTSASDNFLLRDKSWYHSPIRDLEKSPVDSYSYLGMAITAAYFLGEQKMVYAAGAPRANGTGQVVLFTKLNATINVMDVNLVISGEQFASNFGYELATADLNGDDEPDLIVGAPFFFNKDSGGAVYIYMNNENHCFNCNPPIKLLGKIESRFGFAITNLGDLNKDGFEDIAIGAPYEGNGVIYIYQGSAQGIVIEPSQVIKAEDLIVNNLVIRTLGYSLSGNGIDLDENGYPDLISGAYESDMAILIRARPIVNISTSVGPPEKLRNIDPTKPGCSANITSAVTCFTFETCCSLESVVKAGEWGVQLHYKLEAETFQESRKFSRIWFGPDHTIKSQIAENIVYVDHNKKKTCQQHTAYLKENTIDIHSPIALRISYSLVQNEVPVLKPGDPVPSLADLPVLNQNQAQKMFYATFNKDCGNNDKCESQVHINSELMLPKTSENDYKLVMGQHVEVLLNTTAVNLGESAYESRMFITHPFTFNYIGTVKLDDIKQLDCNPFNKTMVVCFLGNPFKKSAVLNIQLRFDPKNLSDSENKLEFIVFSNTTSHEISPQSPLILSANVIKQAELSLRGMAGPEQVFYGGQMKTKNSVKYRDEVGSRIWHKYQVYNHGPWKVSNVILNVEWPYQVASHYDSGKWLLYIDEKPYVEAISGGECYMSEGQVNPVNLLTRSGDQDMPLDSIHIQNSPLNNFVASKSTTNSIKNNSGGYYQNRIRRDQNFIIGAETYTKDNGKHQEIVKMNCLVGNAKCFKFHCLINNLQKDQEATIFIKARLWNTTLLQYFPKVDSVEILSRAKIHVPSNLSLQEYQSDDEFEVKTIAKVDLLETPEPIQLWIIILAILVGLLLLILLTWLLWKLGFFKRRRPDPTLSGNIEKHRVDDNYYEY